MEDLNAVPATATPAEAIKALMMLRAEMVQRETRMRATIIEHVQSLRQEAGQFRRDLAAIVEGAGARIAQVPASGAVASMVTTTGAVAAALPAPSVATARNS